MAHYKADLTPVAVPRVETKHRRIVTQIPAPGSLALIEVCRRYEPRSMATQPPVVWDRAEGFQVYDAFGNCWIDFTSGILVANTGHSHPHVIQALRNQIDRKLLHSYLYTTEVRARLVKKLVEISPPNLTRVYLLSTGSESVECAIKLTRLCGLRKDPAKTVLVSFAGSFHGRTMGAQLLCSAPEPKRWITCREPEMVQIPFPRCSECPWGRDDYDNCGKECFEKGLAQLREQGVRPDHIAGFFIEGYQGVRGPIFWPNDYVQALREWADQHDALLAADEIQSGFGRTGRLFAYEHYGVAMDLVCCGKGLSSCLPLSAVLGRAEIMDLTQVGEMTSTHTGNPLCCAVTLASIEALEQESLVAAAAEKGKVVEAQLRKIQAQYPDRVDMISGRGLVHGLFFVRPGTREPDVELADRVVERAIRKGVMLFITGNGTVKLAPPLVITEEAIIEGIEVIAEALAECVNEEAS